MAEIGDRIGPFELIELVSVGGLSSVFRGVRVDGSSRPPREVTLRVAAAGPDGPRDDALDAVRAEYETLRVLQDERIPQALALYGGHGASATTWVNGASLRETLRLVEEGRLDLDAATSLDILVELAYALRHAHAIVREEGRIVHGALAPEVVWLTAEGKVVLKGCGDPEPAHARPLAPEQQQGVQDPRTDQWLLGALGIELLRHAPEVLPGARGAPVEVAYGLLQAQWPAATRVLARLLAESPADRYEAEERLIKDLLALSRHLGGVSRRAEVGARTVQLAPSLHGTDAPPMPVGPLLQRRKDETPPRSQAGAPPVQAPRVHAGVPPVLQGAPPVLQGGAPPLRPAGLPLRPAGPAVQTAAAAVTRPPRIHPSDPPRVHVDAAPPRVERDEPPGMEEVVAYTEETPLPFKPRDGAAVGPGPALQPRDEPLPRLADDDAAALPLPSSTPTAAPRADLPLPNEPVFRADAEPTMMELGPLFGGPAAKGWSSTADAEATEIYQPRLHGVALEPEPAAERSGGDDRAPLTDDLVGPDATPSLPFRQPPPPVEDPVPDQWVVGALVVFGVIAVLVLVWRFAG